MEVFRHAPPPARVVSLCVWEWSDSFEWDGMRWLVSAHDANGRSTQFAFAYTNDGPSVVTANGKPAQFRDIHSDAVRPATIAEWCDAISYWDTQVRNPLHDPRWSGESIETMLDRVGINAASEALNKLIAHNAKVAQDQTVYQRRYDKLAEEHTQLLAEYEEIISRISDLEDQQSGYQHYKAKIEKLDPAKLEFTPYLWHTLVDHVEAMADRTITFKFRNAAKLSLLV